MKVRRFFLIAFLLFPLLPASFAQILDDFSDGDFTQNPVWQGDGADFIVNASGELQLNAPAPGMSQLRVQGNIPDSAIWELRFRLDFAPSNQNLLRIYVLADQSDLSAANGYFIEIGETGSLDAIRFYRQDAGVKTLLATGTPGLVAVNPDIRLHVKRTVAGAWELAAAAGGGTLQNQFAVAEATYTGGADRFFGFQCVYTTSNIAKFFFDDLSVLPDAPDTQAPVLLSASADDAMTVNAVFDEMLDSLSAVQPAHYSISNGVGQPQSVQLHPDKKTVRLLLQNALATGNYTLQTSGLKDGSGNESQIQTTDFQFVKIEVASEFDILINEIMADPAPSAGLPEVEWLELYNRSAKTIELSTLRIRDAAGLPVALPVFLLPPGGYAVLTAISNASTLQAAVSGTVLGAPIGTTALNNDGDVLTLSNASGEVIDVVDYSVDWHTDANKAEGGWSLERINPTLPCLGGSNWKSCPTLPGGTPGAQNASFQDMPDNEPPRLLESFPESATSLLLTFSEGMDKIAAEISAEYNLLPHRTILSAEQLSGDRSRVRLLLGDPLQASVLYALSVGASVTDCSGNAVLATDTAYFALTEAPTAYDIVINEIMAAPSPSAGLPEVEWLELFNRSSRAIDLADLRIQNKTGAPVPLPSLLMLPGTYVALTAAANAPDLQAVTQGKVVGVLPALSNESDILTLSDANGNVIDRVAYEKEWHRDAGKANGGWSLERINPGLPCLGRENWQSCPALPGGTPAARNASFQNYPDNNPPRLYWAYPESAYSVLLTFSEDMDRATAQNPAAYSFHPPLDIASAEPLPGFSLVRLLLDEPLQASVLYSITAGPSATDCAGNAVFSADTVFAGLPEIPEPQDLVFNEIMFNPATGNGPYIEFYNHSQKVFDWSEFFISQFDGGTAEEKITQKRLSLPGQLDVFTEYPHNIRNSFAHIRPLHVLKNDLPTLPNDAGKIRLYWVRNSDTVELDVFHYSEDFHNALFIDSERKGVALERIDPGNLTNVASNWTSASPVVTGAPGTPTLPNSQYFSAPPGSGLIHLPLERLSPDDDGIEDFLPIQYTLPQPGFFATLTIFDSEGIPVKRLVRTELIGVEGTLRWDGDLDNGSRAKPGIYILFLELFAPDGTTERVKKAVAVVKRF